MPTEAAGNITSILRTESVPRSNGIKCNCSESDEESDLWKQYLHTKIQVAEQELILKKEDILLKQAKRKYYEKKLKESNFSL